MTSKFFLVGAVAAIAFASRADLDTVAPIGLDFKNTCVVTGADVTCSFAVKELNEIVKKATGKEFKLESQVRVGERKEKFHSSTSTLSSTPTLNFNSHRILLGRTPEAEAILGRHFFEGGTNYASETSCVFAKGGDVFLVGSDPLATLWAVYDFVEDNLGYRWYRECADSLRERVEIVTKSDRVIYSGKATRRRPGFTGTRGHHNNPLARKLFRLRHRCNSGVWRFVPGYDFHLQGRTFGHGFDMYLPRKTNEPWMGLRWFPDEVKALAPAFERHPEWFSVDERGRRSDAMQLCLSSPATRDALYRSLLWWVKKNGRGVYMIGSNDYHTGRYCFCPDCLALDRKYGVESGVLWDCVIDLCNRLKRDGYEGVYVTSLAYRGQTRVAPLGVTFPDNFICDFAPVSWDRTLSEVLREKLPDGRVYDPLQNCRDWTAACPGGVSYWYYGSESGGYTWTRLQKEVSEIYAAGVRGAGLCGSEGDYGFEDLMMHVWFWTLYHPTGDVRAEFYRACSTKFGPATDELVAFTERLETVRRRAVSQTPLGCGASDLFKYLTDDELDSLQGLFAVARAKTEGTPYADAVGAARVSLDVETAFRRGDAAAERRARRHAAAYCRDVRKPHLGTDIDSYTQRLDEMANYRYLKSDALPPELKGYPKERVTRILPPKAGPFVMFGRTHGNRQVSVPDPASVCGFAVADTIDDSVAPGGFRELRIGLRDHHAGKYLIPFHSVRIPEGFLEDGRYRLLKLGRSAYASDMWFVWTDTAGRCSKGYSPLSLRMISRCFDSIRLDRQFETWISIRAEGPKFFPGDTRENRIFIEQIFSVAL